MSVYMCCSNRVSGIKAGPSTCAGKHTVGSRLLSEWRSVALASLCEIEHGGWRTWEKMKCVRFPLVKGDRAMPTGHEELGEKREHVK